MIVSGTPERGTGQVRRLEQDVRVGSAKRTEPEAYDTSQGIHILFQTVLSHDPDVGLPTRFVVPAGGSEVPKAPHSEP